MTPTPMQIFLAVLDFLLFIVMGVVCIRQWLIFRLLHRVQAMQAATQKLIEASPEEREQWLRDKIRDRRGDTHA